MLQQIVQKNKAQQSATPKNEWILSGTMTAADIKNNKIEIEEGDRKTTHSIVVSTGMIKNLLRFYLEEWGTIQLEKDAAGSFYLKNIQKTFSA